MCMHIYLHEYFVNVYVGYMCIWVCECAIWCMCILI